MGSLWLILPLGRGRPEVRGILRRRALLELVQSGGAGGEEENSDQCGRHSKKPKRVSEGCTDRIAAENADQDQGYDPDFESSR